MNIELIVCSSNRLIEAQINKIVKNNNVLYLNMLKNDYSELFEEIGYSFFLDEKKFIVVKNLFSNIKEEYEEKLLNYLKKPNEKVVLIFTEEKVDARKKLIKLIKKDYSFKLIDIDYQNVYGLVDGYIKEHGFTPEYGTTKFLVNLFGLNIDLIFSELDKVFLYYEKPLKLNIDKIKDIVSVPLNTNSFKFVDAVINKNLELSENILEDLLVCKTEINSLIILIAREFRLISFTKTYYDDKLDFKSIAKNLKLQEWQVDKYYKYSLNYSIKEINNILKMLGDYDYQTKTGSLDKYSAIQLILFSIIL